jgi:predicted nuclease of predicted toxin-antitoxin system
MTTTTTDTHDRLLIDEMFSAALAHQLVQLGVDCRSVAEDPDLSRLSDESVAEAALEEDRVLVTDNAVDFEILRRRWEAEGRTMPKLIYTCDDRFPRNRSFARSVAEALVAAVYEQRASREGGVYWLSPPAPSGPELLPVEHEGNHAAREVIPAAREGVALAPEGVPAAPEGVPEPSY